MKEKNKDNFGISFFTKFIEMIFWFITISAAIFLNLSNQVFQGPQKLSYLFLFLSAVIIILLVRGIRLVKTNSRKIVFASSLSASVLLPLLLLDTAAGKMVIFYYLPTVIAILLTSLVMMDVKIYYIFIVGLCIFFLGDAFMGTRVTPAGQLKYPLMFMGTFSLTLLIMFTYYLYAKERIIRARLNALTERLKTIDRLKSDFVTNVSHELRTPLTSIRNAAVLLKTKTGNKDAFISVTEEELLEIIVTNSDRQSRLIDTLLDLAKIEKGRLSMGRALANVGNIAMEAMKSLVIQAHKNNVELVHDVQPDLPNIYVSADQIIEVFTNLIDNAIKYNKKGGKVIVHVKVAEGCIESVVEDTGIGILAENVDKLFEKFKRFNDDIENKDRKKGTGLGLVIAKEIVQMHGGKISVESKIGEGTKVRFTLPAGLRKKDQELLKNEE